MGIAEYVGPELSRELDKKSQEFYEFIMPAIDMYEDVNDLIVEIDLPGFKKEDIHLRIVEDNILSIKARREKVQEPLGLIHYIQRPIQIDRRIMLPYSTKDGERVTATAKYENGVITLRIPIPKIMAVPIT
jgi:HSP20 family protein